MNDLISVIVPVYNAYETIRRCVSTITGQTYSNLQIILVDDGSTDGSGELCAELAEKDGRIEVIRQDNGGVSSARNTGLKHVRGAWLCWVDADDYVSPHYIEDMAAAADGCDMSICAYKATFTDGDFSFSRLDNIWKISGREACKRKFKAELIPYNRVIGKLYRSELWNGIVFPLNKIGEDLFVSHTILYRAKRIAIFDAVLYAYVQTDVSITRSDFSVKRFDALDAYQEGVRFYKSVNEGDLTNISARMYCSRTFDAWYICKKNIRSRETLRALRRRGIKAYDDIKKIRDYADYSKSKSRLFKIKFFIGRWCIPLYTFLFTRGWRRNI